MDSNFDQTVNELLRQDGVKGVLLADKHGLCLVAKGEAQPTASGYFTSVLAKAAENGQEPATVCIEADKFNILLRKQDDLVVAIYKLAPAVPAQ